MTLENQVLEQLADWQPAGRQPLLIPDAVAAGR